MKKIYLMFMFAFMLMSQISYADLSILVVNDNGYALDRVDVIKNAISNSDYTYTFYDASVEGASPSYELMSGFDLVVWYTGNDSAGLFLWDGLETDNEGIIEYLDNGGMLWIQGLDFLFDRYATTPYDFVAGDFVYDYMGISQYFAQSHVDDGFYSDGVPQLDVVAGNGIFTQTPILWAYETMWYADAILPVDVNSGGVYKMGPTGYDFEDYYGAVYNEIGDAKVLTMTVETARFDTQENTDSFFAEGLAYFEQFGSGAGVAVESISVSGESGAISIEENGGTLQMYAEVLPEDATNQVVLWSVTPGTAYANINSDGVLSATGTVIGNGTCWVKATAADGTGVADSVEITISNQVNNPDFEILLVNDNANGTDRYLVLDTTLMNLDYAYDVHNTVETSTRPTFAQMSAYDLVIWYTGNDGVSLNLWDVSDTNNYKFNQDLINYININGNVWVQGLDFMYDAVGGAPVAFTAGQFIYDEMGISNYVGQSYVDDNSLGVPQLDVDLDNGISEFTPITWVYETMWYADAFEITSTAKGMYKMGPTGYVLDDYYSALYTHNTGKGFIMTWAFETARIDTRENTEEIFDEVLSYIKDNSGTGIQEWENSKVSIKAVYPNPSLNVANIDYILESQANVELEIYDITGRLMNAKNFGSQSQGQHQLQINKNQMNLQNGIYLYTIRIDEEKYTGKVIFK